MKKDIFDINFFLNLSEVSAVCDVFPHRLFDSYRNLVSSAQEELLGVSQKEPLNDEKLVSIAIESNGEIFFMLEALTADSSYLKSLLQLRIEQHLEHRRLLYSYDYNKNCTHDLLGFLLSGEKNTANIEDALMQALSFLRSKLLIKSCHLFIVNDKVTITPWIGVMDNGQEFLANQTSHVGCCDLICATLVANVKKLFLSNCPRDNKTYQSCGPNAGSIPNNFIYVPLIKKGEVLAVLELKDLIAGEFTDKELNFVHGFVQVVCQFISEHISLLRIKKSEKTSVGLEKYLSYNVVEKIKKREIDNKELIGVEKDIVVLFAKINNFSEISEKLSASSLIDLLNYHYELMARIITRYDGTIDKIIGNVIMAVWNHPESQENALELCMDAAMEMQQAAFSQILPVWKERGITNYGLGIGINRGKAVAGNLGAKQFMDFTVIGDTINLAQRLESKAGSGEIWIKTDVVLNAKQLKVKPDKIAKAIKIKGKAKPIDAFVFIPVKDEEKKTL